MIGQAKIDNWFSYHVPTDAQIPAFAAINAAAKALVEVIDRHCPDSADKSDAVRKVREARMTANAAIACGGQ